MRIKHALLIALEALALNIVSIRAPALVIVGGNGGANGGDVHTGPSARIVAAREKLIADRL